MANADELTVNVFDWVGPLNVPDYSKHDYLARGGEPGESGWLDPEGGITDSITQLPEEWDQITIKWNAGPQVGKAVYQASQGYIWDLQVNVVQVLIENPDLLQPFRGGTPRDAGTERVNEIDYKVVSSGNNGIPLDEGMKWAAKVTLNGPNGGRGVKFIWGGFVQTLNATQYNGDYYPGHFPGVSDMEGNSYLDCTREERGDTPYYVLVEQSPNAFFRGWVASVSTIYDFDIPGAPFPLSFSGGQLESVYVVWDFHLYIVAQTWDRRDCLDQYTSRADATWRFRFSSGVDVTDPYACHDIVAADEVTRAWTPVTGWSEPAHINDDEIANQVLHRRGFFQGA